MNYSVSPIIFFYILTPHAWCVFKVSLHQLFFILYCSYNILNVFTEISESKVYSTIVHRAMYAAKLVVHG